MRDTIDAVDSALRAQAAGSVDQPLRVMVRPPAGFFGAMPSAIAGMGLGAKLVSFFPRNGERGLHTHHAVIALFDQDNGVPTALLDGRLITEMRTAATSAVATRELAVEGAGVTAVLGTGVQARAHIAALREVGLLKEARIWGRTPAHANALASWASDTGAHAMVAGTVSEACKGADVVCTLTPAQAPLLFSKDVEPGCHVNAVGGSAPSMQELDAALVARARLIVDTIEGAMKEAGDILGAIRAGVLPPQPELTRLCDVVAGKSVGRTSKDDVTVFKSLGMAIEDLACAALAYDRARARGLGQQVQM
jgi:thiomorpholine-carboxylate dehydrogenase